MRPMIIKSCRHPQALTVQLASAAAHDSHSAAAVQLASSALSTAHAHLIGGPPTSEIVDEGVVTMDTNKLPSDKRLTGRAVPLSKTPVLKLLMQLACRMDSHQAPGQATGRAAGQSMRAETLSAAEACILLAFRTYQMDDLNR